MVESDRPADTGHENFEPAMAGPPVSGCQAAPGGNPSGEPVQTLDCMIRIRASTLTSTQRLVLTYMALRATGTEGIFTAAIPTLAADTQLSPRTVQTAIAELVGLGWVTLVRAFKNAANEYRVTIPTDAPTYREKAERRGELTEEERKKWGKRKGGAAVAGQQPLQGGGADDAPGGCNTITPEVQQLHGGGAVVADDQGSQDLQVSDQAHHQGASLPLEASAPPVETKQKASKSKAPKEPNAFTEAWATAYRSLADGAAYPWGSSFHRCKAMTKDLLVKPNSELVESATRFLKANAKPNCERWLHSLRDEQVRAPLARQHATVDEMLGLFEPHKPEVQDHKPEPEPHKPPAYEADILAARERRTKPKEVSRG